ncbi:hypothetical protein Hanom_Chr16g01506271 [Helianthus anomalus]
MVVRTVPSFITRKRFGTKSTYALTALGSIVPPSGKYNFSRSFLSQYWFGFCLLIQSYGTLLESYTCKR